MPTCKDQIIDLLRSTGRRGIGSVLSYMDHNHFYSSRCHSHHLYSGGLADHSLEVYKVAMKYDSGLPLGSIIISTLLHDFNGAGGYRDLDGHGRRSLNLLKRIGLEMTGAEKCAIRNHMRHPEEISSNWDSVMCTDEGRALQALVYKSDRTMPQMNYLSDQGFQISRHLVSWKFWRFIMGRQEMPMFDDPDNRVDLCDRAPMVGLPTAAQRDAFLSAIHQLTGKQYSFATYPQYSTALLRGALEDTGTKAELFPAIPGFLLVNPSSRSTSLAFPSSTLSATPLSSAPSPALCASIAWRLTTPKPN